jgi:hypothetical protein
MRRRWRSFVLLTGGGGCFSAIAASFLQLALLFGFPCLVVISRWKGSRSSRASPTLGSISSAEAAGVAQRAEFIHAGSLVRLVMFQVILLALIGSTNAAREIAGERLIFEKENLRTAVAATSRRRRLFSAAGRGAVGLMGVFRQSVSSVFRADSGTQFCAHPGECSTHGGLPRLSAIMKTAEQASLSLLPRGDSSCR